MGRFAVDVLEVPTELWKAQIDQAGEPPLGISQFMGNETPLSAKQLKLFGVFLSWLEREEIAVTHGASDEKRFIGIGLASAQMRARALSLAAQNGIEDLHSPIALQQKAPQTHPVVAAGFQAEKMFPLPAGGVKAWLAKGSYQTIRAHLLEPPKTKRRRSV